MNLLVITQKVDINDPILGFFHEWINKLAEKCEKLTVICLEKRQYSLPVNVKVLSLGKELGRGPITYLINFYRYIWQYKSDYDGVFVHMNAIYAALAGLCWKMLRKKIVLWYIHPKKDIYLRLAIIFCDKILTASEKSFPILNKKVEAVGHGINTDLFIKKQETAQSNALLYVGRISPVKQLEILGKAMVILSDRNLKLNIVGGYSKKDEVYYQQIRTLFEALEDKGVVSFFGTVKNSQMSAVYNENKILINLTRTGSFDKVILEAMSCECLVLVCNIAFKEILEPKFFFKEGDAQDLAQKIGNLFDLAATIKADYGKKFRQYVFEKHNLNKLIEKIILCLER